MGEGGEREAARDRPPATINRAPAPYAVPGTWCATGMRYPPATTASPTMAATHPLRAFGCVDDEGASSRIAVRPAIAGALICQLLRLCRIV